MRTAFYYPQLLAAFLAWCCLAALCLTPVSAHAERIKDLSSIEGVRSNQLIGYGLVVGLDGTGDQTTQTPFTTESLTNMLSRLGVNVPPGTTMQLNNVAAVMVTARLPAFAVPGQTIDVTVSSLGNAKSLRGGTLLLTPLRGANGRVYAMAQGNILVGGAGASSPNGGTSVQVNHLSVGRISAGATVERSVPNPLDRGNSIQLDLDSTDFLTAQRVVEAINRNFGSGTASAIDGRSVRVLAPQGAEARVAFIAQVENLEVAPARAAAMVILDPRTGSVVMNQSVTVEPCAVAHGNLSVIISSQPVISQPAPFSRTGQTVSTQRTQIQLREQRGRLTMIPRGVSLSAVVRALNAIGATPQDLLSILQAMKAAGALRAQLRII